MPTIAQVMTREPAFLRDDESIQRAAELMADLDVGELPICDGRRLVGVVTDRDITVRCVARGATPASTRVSEAMSSGPQWCFEDDAVEDASRKMAERQLRRLMVLDRDKQLVGVVSLGDLAVKAGAGGALKDVSAPAQPAR
ncbi:CBS domain-containing protein [Orrella sp. JC864]|uniref:CBS domain-containing protein n=1 Tax=Orrella sp. JC864 TaxID=3120298 RepID=UPI00300BC075